MSPLSPDWIPFLRKVGFFAGFREEDMQPLVEKMQMLSLPKGAVLYREGEETDALYLIQSGRVRLVDGQGSNEKTSAFLGRGDALGEMGLLTGETRAKTAVVEATAELVVLYKKDFEELLAAHPYLALPISRVLSARLIEAGRRAAAPGRASRIYTLTGPFSTDDRVVLAVNLAVALVEQTRRRVLLLDILDEESGAFAKALGLTPVKVNEHSLRQDDLHNPELLHRLCALHASGLELMSLPRNLLEGKFFGVIYSFLATLRHSHDVVLIVLPGKTTPAARAALEEADAALVAVKDARQAADVEAQEGVAAVVPPEKRWTVRLEEGVSEPATDADTHRVPWRATFTATRTPFLPSDAVESQRALDRLARKMGGLSVGFAMGSGAALGYVMIGFLKVLERHGIFPDVIAGTSMGALVGSFYAAGKSPAELEEIALSITKARLWGMADFTLPRQGLILGGQVLKFLRSILGDRTFAEMRLPFACVATDIMNGEEVVLRHGKVAEAVRASLSLPFFFQPFFHHGRYLVDGGLTNPVPTSTIAAMGADVLISVNITTKPAEKRIPGQKLRRRVRKPGFFKGPNIFEVLLKTIYTMQFGIAQTHAQAAHVVLDPDLSAFTWADFHRASDVIKIGEDYIEEFIPKIKSHLPFFADTCRVPLRRS